VTFTACIVLDLGAVSEVDDIKQRQSVVWGLGDYAVLARWFEPAAAALCDLCAVSAGQEVLDVGAGSGINRPDWMHAAVAAVATRAVGVELDPELILMTMAMTKYDAEARKVPGVRIAAEGFADRVYADDAQLVSRKLGKDALITDPAKAADQAVRMAMEGKVRTITGKTIDVKVETICIHGDSPGSDKIVAAVREALVKAGAIVKPLRDWLPKK